MEGQWVEASFRLIYLHRYQPDTIARIRTDYVHEQQARYRTAIEDLEKQVAAATSTSERVKLTKQLNKVQAQDNELHQYEEKVHALADQMIKIDLDDGVKHNYEIFCWTWRSTASLSGQTIPLCSWRTYISSPARPCARP